MEKSGINSRRTACWLPLAAAVLAALVALTGCPQTTDSDPVPGAPAKPVITSIKSGNTQDQDKKTGQGGEIAVSWQPVEYAARYEVYYAPKTTTAEPAIPETAATTVAAPATYAAITGNAIGDSTMNYYVWVRAINDSGAGDASPPASTLDRFLGVWTAANSADGYNIDATGIRYSSDYSGNIAEYIRAVVSFGNGIETVDFQGKTGAAGVIVIEYDKSVDTNPNWSHLAGKYFVAIYYYGLTGNGAGSSAYFGQAADLAGTWGEPDYGCDVSGVDEAIEKFTYEARDSYISSLYDPVIYNWSSSE